MEKTISLSGQLIYGRIAAAMADVDAIGKDRKNTQQGYNFRGIDDVYNTLHPILARHKIFTCPRVVAERSEERQTKNGGNLIYRVLTVEYDVYTDDGSKITCCVIGEGMDSGDKATNKALSVAHKMMFFQLFAIPVEGETIDSEIDSPEVIGIREEFKKLFAAVKNPTEPQVQFANTLESHNLESVKSAIVKLKILNTEGVK